MPNKAYAILHTEENEDIGHFYFPIKLDNNRIAYPGMPQFFGGNKEGNESDLQTIVREAAEESNNQITITALGERIHHCTVNGDSYSFYIVTRFTGQHFVGPLPGNNEMAAIRRYQVHAGETDDIIDFFRRLEITMSEALATSATREAFEAALEYGQRE